MKTIIEIPQEEYFQRPEISSSMLKDFNSHGPWTYYHKYVAKDLPERQPSDSMRIGSALHALICEDHLDILAGNSESAVAITPSFIGVGAAMEDINMRKPKHREYIKDWRKDRPGKIFINSDEFNQVLGMKASVTANPALKPYMERLNSKRTEVIATNVIADMPVRAMCDADFSDVDLIIDFKTTRQHVGIEFAKDAIFKFGYQYQAAHYCDVFNAQRFIFVAIRNFPPYEAVAFEMPEHMISQARIINHDSLRRIAWCQAMDDWHTDGWNEIVDLGELIENR